MINKRITKIKYLISRKSIKFKLNPNNLLINPEALGDEGVPINRLLKKTGEPIKIPYKFWNDRRKEFPSKIVNISGITTKTIDDCLNKIAIPMRIEIWLIEILSIKIIIKNKNIE